MVGSLITRAIIMVLGYLYPAYECFKSVERNRPDLEHLRFWCQYWMIIALVTVSERLGDALISWVPMYSEAKLAFIIYLWYPKTKGTTYVYSTFVRPFVAKHEQDIDRNMNELRTSAGDVAFTFWQHGSTYFQTRFLELLQYLASQSPRAHGPPRVQAPPAARDVYPPPPPPGPMPGPGPTGMNRPSAPPPPPVPPGMTREGIMREALLREGSLREEEIPPYFPDELVGPGGYMTRSRQRASTARVRKSV